MKNMLKSEGGFTLVELLGVIAIIAVLAAVAITSIAGAIQAGRESSARRQAQVLQSAYQNYLAAGGADVADVDAALSALTNEVTLVPGTNVGPFLTTTVDSASLSNFAGSGLSVNFSPSAGFFTE